jgi:ABC-2 type transport system ATP-binding protein
MDPQGREEMLDLINRIHRHLGIAVVISSHILEDIERVCDYVTILNDGRLVMADRLATIGTGATELVVRVEGDPAPFRAALEAAGLATRSAEDALVPGEFLASLENESVYDLIRDTAAERGESLRTLRPRARTLEDVYLGNVVADTAGREAANAGR